MLSYKTKHQLKCKAKHKINKNILNPMGFEFCSWCDKIIKSVPYVWRCTECQAKYTELRNEELEQDEYEDYISNYEDMRYDLD
jgi:hypothetical protein